MRPLALIAHGSTDPRFARTVEEIAELVRALRPGLEVRVGYLEHGPPHAGEAATAGAVAVPLLLASGYHVLVDLPAQAPGATIARALGPDDRLCAAVADRLREAGWDGTGPVALGAAGSADPGALDDVRAAAARLAALLDVPVTAAFISAGEPRVADVGAPTVASYLLAPGVFQDALGDVGARLVSAPIGAHPAVAAVVLDRYDATCQDVDD